MSTIESQKMAEISVCVYHSDCDPHILRNVPVIQSHAGITRRRSIISPEDPANLFRRGVPHAEREPVDYSEEFHTVPNLPGRL